MRYILFSAMLFSVLTVCNNNKNDSSASSRDNAVTDESTEKQPASANANAIDTLTCDFLKGTWSVKNEPGAKEMKETWYFECIKRDGNHSFPRVMLKPMDRPSVINAQGMTGELSPIGAIFDETNKPFNYSLFLTKKGEGLKVILKFEEIASDGSKSILVPPVTYLLTKR